MPPVLHGKSRNTLLLHHDGWHRFRLKTWHLKTHLAFNVHWHSGF